MDTNKINAAIRELVDGAVRAERERCERIALAWTDGSIAGSATGKAIASEIAGYNVEAPRAAAPPASAPRANGSDRAPSLDRTSNGKVAKGDDVRVVRGRKVPIGTEGAVIWIGEGQYGERVGVKDRRGDVHWTSASNVETTIPVGPSHADRGIAATMTALPDAIRSARKAMPAWSDSAADEPADERAPVGEVDF